MIPFLKNFFLAFSFVFSICIPSQVQANIATDTISNIGAFYANALNGTLDQTNDTIFAIKDFYTPLFLDSFGALRKVIHVAYNGADSILNGITALGLGAEKIHGEVIEETGKSIARVAFSTADFAKKIDNNILSTQNALGNAGYEGVSNVLNAGEFIGKVFLNAHDEFVDVSSKTLVSGIGSVADLGRGVIAGTANTLSFFSQSTQGAFNSVNQSKNDSLAGVGSLWKSFIDKISDPLIPLFYESSEFKKTDKSVDVAKPVNNQKENQTSVSIKNSDNEIVVERIIERESAFNLDSALSNLRNELTYLNDTKIASLLEFVKKQGAKTSERSSDSTRESLKEGTFEGVVNTGSFIFGSSAGLLIADTSGTVSASTTLSTSFGGTGTTTSPSYGQLLLGNALGGYDLVATSTLGITSGSSSQWTDSGSDIYFTGGKVGIGTTTPTDMLEVIGNITSHGVLTSVGTSGSVAQLALIDDVNGYGGIDIQTYGGGVTGSPHSYVNLIGSRGNQNSVSNLLSGDDLGMLNFYGQTDSGLELGAAIGAIAASNFSGSSVPTDLFFITSKSERMRIDANGNVGIGTTTPSAKLSVQGDAYIAGNLTATGTVKIANSTSLTLTSNEARGGIGISDDRIYFHGDGVRAVSYGLQQEFGFASKVMPLSDNTYTLGRDGDLRWKQLFLGQDGIRIGNGTSGATITTTGSSPNENLIFTPGGTGNLGIGTTTPSAKLAITGSGTGTERAFTIADSSNAEKFTVLDNGNVGIGTASPQSKLDLSNGGYLSIADNNGIYFRGAGDNNWRIGNVHPYTRSLLSGASIDITAGGDQTEGFSVGRNNGNSYFEINANGTGFFRGNLGIGTTTPSAKLAVQGNALIMGTTTVSALYSTGSATVDGTVIANAFMGDGSGIIGLNASNVSNGILGIAYGGTGTSTAPAAGELLMGDGLGGYSLVATSSLGIPASQWTTSGSNIYYTNGNVGIGTTNPGAKLEIESGGGQNSGLNIDMTSVGNYGTIDFNTPSGLIGQFLATGASYSNGIFTGDQIALANYGTNGKTTLVAGGTNGFINFSTGGYALSDEKMRITSAGNVGIGTTTPADKLSVIGSGHFTTGLSVGGAAATTTGTRTVISTNSLLAYSGTEATARLRMGIAGVTNGIPGLVFDSTLGGLAATGGGIGQEVAQTLSFYTGNGSALTERARISSLGYFGIGTTTPIAQLALASGQISVPAGSASAPSYSFGNGLGTGIYSTAANKIGFAFGGTLKGTWDSTGLRIGDTTAPSGYMLQVMGTSGFNGNMTTTGQLAFTNNGSIIGYSSTENLLGGTTNFRMSGSPYTTYASINGNTGASYFLGNTGIGTTTPSAKLAITGTAGTGDVFAIASSTNANVLTVNATAPTSNTTGVLTVYDNGAAKSSDGAIISIHADDNSPFLGKFYNHTYSTSNPVMTYYADNSGNFTQDGPVSLKLSRGSNTNILLESTGTTINQTTGSTALLVDTTGSKRMIIKGGGTAPTSLGSSYYLGLGNTEYTANSYRLIGLGYSGGGVSSYPAYMGYQEISSSGNTYGDLVFGTRSVTTDTSATERLRITSAGNIGIGTTSPTAKLAITSSGTGTGSAFVVANSSNAEMFKVLDNGTVSIPAGARLTSIADTTTGLYVGSDRIRFDYQNSEKWRVDFAGRMFLSQMTLTSTANFAGSGIWNANGEVGIGTTTPVSKLAVVGQITAASSTQNVGISLHYNGSSGREYAMLSCYNCGSAGLGGLEIYDSTAGAARAYIQAGVNGWQTPSDLRLKENVETLSVLEKIDSIRGTLYTLKDSGIPQIGVIAQEIKLAFPEAVSGSEEDGRFLGVNYNSIAAIALQGVKELNDVLKTILAWFDGGKFNVQNDICVDDVCVTKEQFKQMLLNNGGGTHYEAPEESDDSTADVSETEGSLENENNPEEGNDSLEDSEELEDVPQVENGSQDEQTESIEDTDVSDSSESESVESGTDPEPASE